MTIVNAIFSNFLAFIMCIVMTSFPYAGIELPVIDNAKPDCQMTAELMSDVHIEKAELFRQAFMKTGFRNIKNAKCDIDAVVISGDLTNYADEPSLAKYYEIIKKYSPAPVISAAGNHDIGHAGDRDVTDISREEAMANFIRYNNEYMGTDNKNTYYSTEVNGYKFIVIGDECINGGSFDHISMTEEQMRFIDSELADGTKDGKPAFVICHWPVDNINGQDTIWPGCGINLSANDIKSVMEKYNNVFYISGHMHAGIKSKAVEEYFGLSSCERVNGVTYISLPTYGIINIFGEPWSGIGMQLEVYENEVIFRPRNFITNKWYTNSAYTFELVK